VLVNKSLFSKAPAMALALATLPAYAQTTWTGSWAAAPVAATGAVATANSPDTNALVYRNIVHLSLGGKTLRLRISNEFGTASLTLSSVHVAMSASAGAIKAESDHAVKFGGVDSVVIPVGSLAVSDPVKMPVSAFADLAVSIALPQQAAAMTWHQLAMSTNYVAPGSESVSAVKLEGSKTVNSWFLLKGVDVDAGLKAAAVVVLGASISDGYHSTMDANARWPDDLARRLQANAATAKMGVLDEGISGNRLLHDMTGPSALARLDRDVLAQSGVKYVIISLGTNDIGRTFFPMRPGETVTAEQLTWSLQQIAIRAHARGIKVLAATLGPFGGAGYFSADGEAMRQAYNNFVKTSPVFDGVIDFDKVSRDPEHPEKLLPSFDSGDHLHPNDAGYKAMADSIDLKLFAK
jgi:lysophospholipase L1-like esterase